MKFIKLRWHKKRTTIGLFVAVALVVLLFEYQNCSPSSSGASGLSLGGTQSSTGTTPPVTSGYTIGVLPSSATTTPGSSVTFTATASGGTAPYSYSWTLNGVLVSACPVGPASTSCTVSVSTLGMSNLVVVATDATSLNTTASIPITVSSGNGGSPVAALTVSPTTVTTGSAATLSTSVSGGVAPYSYSWGLTGSSSTTCTTSTANCSVTFSSVGVYPVQVTVIDANHNTSIANGSVTVSTNGGGGGVTILLATSSTNVTAGGSVTLTATMSGAAAISYNWSTPGGSSNCTTGTSTCSVTYPNAGSFSVSVTGVYVVYGGGYVATTSAATSTISVAAGVPKISVSVGPQWTGSEVSINATVTGGQAPYTYYWQTYSANYVTGCTTSSAYCGVTYYNGGAYSVYLSVTDANNVTSLPYIVNLNLIPNPNNY